MKRVWIAGLVVAALAVPTTLTVVTAAPQGPVTSYVVPASDRAVTPQEMASARPFPLPQSPVAPDRSHLPVPAGALTPSFQPGMPGDGVEAPVRLPVGDPPEHTPGREEYGTSTHVFTTARVDLVANKVSKMYPHSAAGKLYFKIGANTYVCSAALIKRGVIVTAAHCVTDFGGDWYGSWTFVPARYDGLAPFGVWIADMAAVIAAYKTGTDSCTVAGIVCQNDIATLLIKPKMGAFPGTRTGWFGFGVDGFGFASGAALISQLGYPVSHDAGVRMQRTDSEGYVDAGLSNNTVWGTRQTGGASGGPEVVNLGIPAVLNGTSSGSDANPNIVVGVTSWGYVSTGIKQQGASPFTGTNIGLLVKASCSARPAACS